ncbi:MAG TPA: hypothetical protein VN922_16425, partial [Bacteroidia bacterium]|nr:hypothetical protein [Bacteroidia bacterium]
MAKNNQIKMVLVNWYDSTAECDRVWYRLKEVVDVAKVTHSGHQWSMGYLVYRGKKDWTLANSVVIRDG